MSVKKRVCDFCGCTISPYRDYSWLRFCDSTVVFHDGTRYKQEFYYIDMCDCCADNVFIKIRELKEQIKKENNIKTSKAKK